MSRDDDLDYIIDDLVERYLLFLRGRGPEPDLSVLPADRRADVMAQLEIVAALADRDPELPPIEEDRVAIRLGLVGPASSDHAGAGDPTTYEDPGSDDDPVMVSLQDLAFRFNKQVVIDFASAWTPPAPTGLQPVARCTALGETVAVLLTDVANWAREPENVARFFREHPGVSAVGLVSADAEQAVVVTAADAHHSVDPVLGWLAPHSPSVPEPLGIALGRYFDQWLPDWERVADLDELLGLDDLTVAVAEISSAQLAEVLRSKPRLAYKKESVRALGSLDSSAIAAVVVDVHSGRLAGEDVVDRLARLAETVAS
jgi:hypothetical protein